MKRMLFSIGLAASAFCLAAGYSMTGSWIGVGLAILSGVAWLLAWKYSWLPYLCLFASVGLAAAGLLSRASPWLMLCGACGALATWDLLLLEYAMRGSAPGEETNQYERKHLQALALALGCGLGVTLLGSLLNLQIPFVILVALAALVIVGLERVWKGIKS